MINMGEEGFDYEFDPHEDDDGWQAYKDDLLRPHPDDYDGPRCDRCGDYYEIRRRIGTGMRPCPSCNPGRIRNWWWRNVSRHWYEWRTRRRHRLLKAGNFDDEAPF